MKEIFCDFQVGIKMDEFDFENKQDCQKAMNEDKSESEQNLQ